MNVLHCFTGYLPETENWAYRLLHHSKEDISHHIFAQRYRRSRFFDPDFSLLQLPGGFTRDAERLFRWPANFAHVAAAHVPVVRDRWVRRFAGDRGIDLIHAHFAHNGWRYRQVSRRLGVPLVVSFYGYDYEYLPFTRPGWKSRYRTLFEEADLFLCEGDFGAGRLRQLGCPAEKVKVLHLGVETERIPVAPRRKEPGELNLVQIAWLSEKKGHVYTVDAFLDSLSDCPNMSLTIVGTEKAGRGRGGIRERLVGAIRAAGAEERVSFVDRIDYADLHAYLARFHVFIHPSCYSSKMDCEGGAPVVLLDAQATGMPVIATTHCDIPEEVVHRSTGLLAPERDTATLANYIRTYYRMSQKEYDGYATEARAHVERNFNAPESGRRLAEYYAQVQKNTPES